MKAASMGLLAAALGLLATSAHAQIISGTVVADDTGSPLAGATVVAVGKVTSHAQSPAIYKASVDSAGNFSAAVANSTYQLCVHGAGLYVDPCVWGGAAVANVSPAGAETKTVVHAALRLRKGVSFVVRIHDLNGHLSAAEELPSTGVSVCLSGDGVAQLPLPVTYNSGRVRDYSTVVPVGAALKDVVRSGAVGMVDSKGNTPGAQGLSFVATAPTTATPSSLPASLAIMFPPPTTQMIHFYVTAPQ